MRWYLDTEFDEKGYERINLISLALVCEDGREFYTVASDGWSPFEVNPWVRDNVLPYLSPDGKRSEIVAAAGLPAGVLEMIPRHVIKERLLALIPPSEKPEFYGYFADYDWVLFAQLFGTMLDLPKHFPLYCRDLKQEMDRLGVTKKTPGFPKQAGTAHNALADARHLRDIHKFLETWDKE